MIDTVCNNFKKADDNDDESEEEEKDYQENEIAIVGQDGEKQQLELVRLVTAREEVYVDVIHKL